MRKYLQYMNYQLAKQAIGPVTSHLICPTGIEGTDHIPPYGPALLVCNHRSFMDPFLLAARIERPISFVMASFLSNTPIFRQFAETFGAVPLVPQRGGRVTTLIESLREPLSDGRLIGIFPEGMANFAGGAVEGDGKAAPPPLAHFHAGFARIALATQLPKLPIIPVAIRGYGEKVLSEVSPKLMLFLDPSERLFADGRSMQLTVYTRAHIRIGQPFYFDEHYAAYRAADTKAQVEMARRLAGEVRDAVAGLLQ